MTDPLEQRLRDAFEASARGVTREQLDHDRETQLRRRLAEQPPAAGGGRLGGAGRGPASRGWRLAAAGLTAAAMGLGVLTLTLDREPQRGQVAESSRSVSTVTSTVQVTTEGGSPAPSAPRATGTSGTPGQSAPGTTPGAAPTAQTPGGPAPQQSPPAPQQPGQPGQPGSPQQTQPAPPAAPAPSPQTPGSPGAPAPGAPPAAPTPSPRAETTAPDTSDPAAPQAPQPPEAPSPSEPSTPTYAAPVPPQAGPTPPPADERPGTWLQVTTSADRVEGRTVYWSSSALGQVHVTSPGAGIMSFTVEFGDGDREEHYVNDSCDTAAPIVALSQSLASERPHVYAAPGTYTIRVTVSYCGDQSAGSSSSGSAEVTVP